MSGSGGQVPGGGLLGNLGSLEIPGPADAVPENGVEHRLYRALGKVVLGNQREAFKIACGL